MGIVKVADWILQGLSPILRPQRVSASGLVDAPLLTSHRMDYCIVFSMARTCLLQ